MGNRTVIVVLGVAALLLGFIFFIEKGEMTTSERLGRKERVFTSFRRDFVDSFAVEGTGGGAVEIQKAGGTDSEPDTYRIIRPKELETDKGEIGSVLSALDYLIAKRVIKGEGERNQPQYGLTSPRIKGKFVIRGKATGFVVGADAGEDEVYLAVDGTDHEFYVVEESFLESVDKTVDELRSKALIRDDLESALGVRFAQETQKIALRKDGGHTWQIESEGNWILANASQVHELLHSLGGLKAKRFVKDDASVGDLKAYGLGESGDEIRVALPEQNERVIRIGTPCADQSHEVHVGVVGSGVVACVEDDFQQVVARPAERFRESRPAVFQEEDVDRIALIAGGDELVLTRRDDGFQIEKDLSFQLDKEAVSDLIGALTKTEAKSLRIGQKWISPLREPNAKVKVALSHSPDVALSFYRDGNAKDTMIRRGDEPALLVVSEGVLDQVQPNRLNFRKRKIETGDENDIEAIKIEGAVSQELKKVDGSFQIVQPMEMNGDGMGARRVAGLVAHIEVERFVDVAARPKHGFQKPFAVITATYATAQRDGMVVDQTDSKQVVLELGAVAEGKNRYARVLGKDNTVFVVKESYQDAVRAPLIARDLLQVDETAVVRMALTTQEATVHFEKRNGKWVSLKNTDIGGEQIAGMLTDLGALKTIRADSFTSLDEKKPATLTLQLWNEKSATTSPFHVIRFGERSPDPDEKGFFASQDNLSATFVVPARIVEDLLSLVQS